MNKTAQKQRKSKEMEQMAGEGNNLINDILPDELLAHMFRFLDDRNFQELVKCEYVCRTWRRASLDSTLWEYRINRLFKGKQIAPAVRRLPRNCKSTYVAAIKDSKRQFPDLEELMEKLYRLTFTMSMGDVWRSFNPSPQNDYRQLLRRFLANGRYWYPQGDPLFEHPEFSVMMPPEINWVSWDQNGVLYVQITDFPPLPVSRDPETWGWIVGGTQAIYTSIAVADDVNTEAELTSV